MRSPENPKSNPENLLSYDERVSLLRKKLHDLLTSKGWADVIWQENADKTKPANGTGNKSYRLESRAIGPVLHIKNNGDNISFEFKPTNTSIRLSDSSDSVDGSGTLHIDNQGSGMIFYEEQANANPKNSRGVHPLWGIDGIGKAEIMVGNLSERLPDFEEFIN